MPVGRALLYAEPIYLQAERSPMPELRIVVLALQDKLAYGPTFEVALSGSLCWERGAFTTSRTRRGGDGHGGCWQRRAGRHGIVAGCGAHR